MNHSEKNEKKHKKVTRYLRMTSPISKKHRKEEPTKKELAHIRFCSTCSRDISNEIYMKCSRCLGFVQCLECFSVGNEALSHIKSHPFIILEPETQSLFQEGWTAEQEILLLNAIQTCGLGNWHEIAEIMKTKSAIECECHYFQVYIQSNSAPEPIDSILPPLTLPPPPPYDTTPRESRPSIAHEKNLHAKNKKDRTTPAEFSGWMPRRDEFEVEFINDAEQLIAGISFSETEETEVTLSEKLNQLKTYNISIEERRYRTEFVVNWDLLDRDFRSFGYATNKSEAELEESLLPLGQIVPKVDLENFVSAITNEKRTIEEVENLVKWIKNGIITRDEGILFNNLEKLINEERLSSFSVERWNREVISYTESPDYKEAIDRQLVSEKEVNFCNSINIQPHCFLRLKGILLQEYTVNGKMDLQTAESYLPNHPDLMQKVYVYMRDAGYFVVFNEVSAYEEMIRSKNVIRENDTGIVVHQ